MTFLLFFAGPANPAADACGKSCTPDRIEQAKVALGLDKPLVVQYLEYMKGLVAGREMGPPSGRYWCSWPCLGYSFKNNQPVWQEIISDLPVTISLAIGAALIWLVAGVSTGIISALKPGSIFDRGAMLIALAGVSLPIYFTGLIALTLFSYDWKILPNVHYVAFTSNPISMTWGRNLLLPCICLAFLYAALYARLTRASMIETMGEDYIRTARRRDCRAGRSTIKHGFRAALTPIVTIFVSTSVACSVVRSSPKPCSATPGVGCSPINAIATKICRSSWASTCSRPCSSSSRTSSSTSCTAWSTRGELGVLRDRRESGESGGVTPEVLGSSPSGKTARRATASERFLEVRDLRVHFPTGDGLVKAVDGLSFDLVPVARSSASSASRARASP